MHPPGLWRSLTRPPWLVCLLYLVAAITQQELGEGGTSCRTNKEFAMAEHRCGELSSSSKTSGSWKNQATTETCGERRPADSGCGAELSLPACGKTDDALFFLFSLLYWCGQSISSLLDISVMRLVLESLHWITPLHMQYTNITFGQWKHRLCRCALQPLSCHLVSLFGRMLLSHNWEPNNIKFIL